MKRSTLFIILIVMTVIAAVFGYIIFNKPVNDRPAEQIEYEVETQRRGFDDGLNKPGSVTEYTLDETGAGIASREVFNIDINKDGVRDRITRSRYENGTAHFYFQYKIELNTPNGFTDITPVDFRTTEGAECALQKFQFIFKPDFQVIKISREWQDSWITPTMASRTIYTLVNNELKAGKPRQLRHICNVSDLF